jgi:microcystin-dependent protein
MKTKHAIQPLVLLLALVVLAPSSRAQVQGPPAFVDYQGTIYDSTGRPYGSKGTAPDFTADPENKTMEFRIYNLASGGDDNNIIWAETQTVTVSLGQFSVRLGSGAQITTPAPLPHGSLTAAFDGSERFLELTVINAGEPPSPILPRLAFQSSPFAFVAERAVRAERAERAVRADSVESGTIDMAELVAAVKNALCPPGSICAYGGTSAPEGWALCDGASVSKTDPTYAGLYEVIGTSFGGTPDGDTFNVPDLRGMFLRGMNGDRSDGYKDPNSEARVAVNQGNPGNQVGSYQSDNTQAHSHQWGYYQTTDLYSWNSSSQPVMALNRNADNQIPGGKGKDDDSMDVINGPGGFWTEPEPPRLIEIPDTETRPNNVYVNYIIKL